MSGLASAAIIGGAALAGSVGSSLIAKGGAGAAGAQSTEAGNEAFQAGQSQIGRNQGSASPYTGAGISSLSQIGALLGYGNLVSQNPGDPYNFNYDPNAYGNALSQVQRFANSSGATLPTYAPTAQSGAVSGSFEADPSYAWRVGQGVGAQDASAAAKGTLLSGAQQQALTKYGQDMGSQEYQNWYQRLMNQNIFNMGANQQNFGQQQGIYSDQQGQWNNALSLLTGVAGMGNSATSAMNAANTGAATGGGNSLASSGNASAGYTNQGGQDLASGIGSGVNNALQAYLLRNAFGGAGGGGGSSYTGSPGGGPNGQ